MERNRVGALDKNVGAYIYKGELSDWEIMTALSELLASDNSEDEGFPAVHEFYADQKVFVYSQGGNMWLSKYASDGSRLTLEGSPSKVSGFSPVLDGDADTEDDIEDEEGETVDANQNNSGAENNELVAALANADKKIAALTKQVEEFQPAAAAYKRGQDEAKAAIVLALKNVKTSIPESLYSTWSLSVLQSYANDVGVGTNAETTSCSCQSSYSVPFSGVSAPSQAEPRAIPNPFSSYKVGNRQAAS